MGSLSRIAHVLCTGGAIFYASDRLWRDLVRFPNSLLQEGNLTLVQRRDCKTSNQVLLSFSFLFVQIFSNLSTVLYPHLWWSCYVKECVLNIWKPPLAAVWYNSIKSNNGQWLLARTNYKSCLKVKFFPISLSIKGLDKCAFKMGCFLLKIYQFICIGQSWNIEF